MPQLHFALGLEPYFSFGTTIPVSEGGIAVSIALAILALPTLLFVLVGHPLERSVDENFQRGIANEATKQDLVGPADGLQGSDKLQHPSRNNTPDQSLLWTLPLEIRVIVYEKLLVSSRTIIDADKLVDKYEIYTAKDRAAPVEDIDVPILYTSRTIYSEALPILYGRNRFYFSESESTERFGFSNLPTTPGEFFLIFPLTATLARL